MAGQDIWWAYWYFHLPNYAFSVLFYTLIGRFMLGGILHPDSPNYVFRWFRRLTDWLIPPVAFITPGVFPAMVLPMVAAYWVVVARVVFFILMYAAGLTPRAPAQAS